VATVPPSDEQLFSAYVAGDEAAFEELVRRWTPSLRSMLGATGLPSAVVDELVQDVFLHLHRSAPDFRAGLSLRPWIVTIALNVRRERSRRLARAAAHSPEAPSPGPVPSEHMERRETVRTVHSALAGLPTAHREVIELHWFAGLPFSEIAGVVGASVPAVKVRAHRGYERMRALLSGRR